MDQVAPAPSQPVVPAPFERGRDSVGTGGGGGGGGVALTRWTWSAPSSPRSAASSASPTSTRSERLRNLALHRRAHRCDAHLPVAPLAQGGRRVRSEKLHLRAVLGEGVPGDEEPEHRLFAGQPLVFGPGGHVGER